MRLVGFNEMKKTKGKVLFMVGESANRNVVGQEVFTEFMYGDCSDKVTSAFVGKDVSLVYGKDYNGRAVVTDINVK